MHNSNWKNYQGLYDYMVEAIMGFRTSTDVKRTGYYGVVSFVWKVKNIKSNHPSYLKKKSLL